MIEPVALVDGVEGDVHAQALEGILVRLGEDHAGVGLAAVELLELLDGRGGGGRGGRADRQSDQHLVDVQPRVAVAQVTGLEILNRLDDRGGDQVDLVRDARQLLQRVEDRRRGRPQQVRKPG